MKALIPIYVKLQSKLRHTMKDEKGATMVEYALMLALIAVVCMAAVQGVATATSGTFGDISAAMP